jgi:hypothetical protein
MASNAFALSQPSGETFVTLQDMLAHRLGSNVNCGQWDQIADQFRLLGANFRIVA